MKNGKEIIVKYRELVAEIPDMLSATGLKDMYIIEKLGISKPTFYRKIKDNSWNVNEVEKLIDILK